MRLKYYILAPVLLIQALWVKQKTPKLPEYKTATNAHVSNQSAFNLLLIGDSSAAGVGALDFESSLMGQLIKHMPHPFNHKLCANSGDTTLMAVDQLSQRPTQKFEVVITALGVNDVISRIKISDWQEQQKQLFSIIKNKHQAELIIVCGLPPMHKFPALPQPLRRVLGNRSAQMDQALERLLKQYPAVHYFPLHNLTDDLTQRLPENLSQGQLAASDGFHPGPAAYQFWAEQLCKTVTRHFGWH